VITIEIENLIRINQALCENFSGITILCPSIKKFCSVENHSPHKLYEPVKVSENDLARDFLLLDLKSPGFQVSPEPTFDDGELGFNQESFSIAS